MADERRQDLADERRPGKRSGRRAGLRRLGVWQTRRSSCLAENSEFAKLTIAGFTGFVRRNEWNDGLKSLLDEPRRMLDQAAIVKDCYATTVGSVGVAGKYVFVKRYNSRGTAYALKNIFRSSRAKRVWRAGNVCHVRGIGVALPLAYLERRKFRMLCESYLLTAAVTGDELPQVLARQAGSVRTKRLMIRQLARQLRRMHDRGIAHRDLKGENIIGQELGNSRHKFFVVDFDGIMFRSVSRRVRAKNLARLVRAVSVRMPLSASDRLRFVKNYLISPDAPHWRKMYRDLVKFAAKLRSIDARGLLPLFLWECF